MKKILILCVLASSAIGLPKRTPDVGQITPRIVNGRDAMYGEFPYQVSLQDGSFGYDYAFCGGSIYNEYYIITAGHCVSEEDLKDPSYLKVYAGDYILSDTDGNEQKIPIEQIILHEDFNSFTLSNDIALLKLTSSLDLSGPYVKPITIPQQGQVFSGECTLSGWGRTETDQNADILQAVNLTIISDDECRAVYGAPDVEDSMICAGGGTEGACGGDSGGPFACVVDSQTFLAGIASWGNGCGLSGYPGVLVEASYYTSWIEQHANV